MRSVTTSPKSFTLEESRTKCALDIDISLQFIQRVPLLDIDVSKEAVPFKALLDFIDVSLQAVPLSDSKYSTPSDSLLCLSPCEPLYHDDDILLKKNGLTNVTKIRDIQQGDLLSAQFTSDEKAHEPPKKVIIKKVSRELYYQRIAKKNTNDDMVYCVNKDIVKEAVLLHRLTTETPFAYIIKLHKFFQSDDYLYLVLEDVGDHSMNLKEFVNKSHAYLRNGQLSRKEYLKVIKFVFWQIMVTMHWMHNVMKCCHLDLKLEHILLKDVHFKTDPKTDSIQIRGATTTKLCDFGSADFFENNSFECDQQYSALSAVQYKSPLLLNEEPSDGRKADIWALGIIFCHCLIGEPLYQSLADDGFSALQSQNLEKHLKKRNLRKYVNKKSTHLLNGMLSMDESKRFLTADVLKHKWFKSYYAKYKDRIVAESDCKKNITVFMM